MPPAARVTDMHTCPQVTGTVPHVGGPVIMGEPTVLIGMMMAARMDDVCTCTGPPDTIAKGSATVEINRKKAARLGDLTKHGGVIVSGFATVLIGDVGSGGAAAAAGALKAASDSGAALVCKGPCAACGHM